MQTRIEHATRDDDRVSIQGEWIDDDGVAVAHFHSTLDVEDLRYEQREIMSTEDGQTDGGHFVLSMQDGLVRLQAWPQDGEPVDIILGEEDGFDPDAHPEDRWRQALAPLIAALDEAGYDLETLLDWEE